jgi:hypothetical protein
MQRIVISGTRSDAIDRQYVGDQLWCHMQMFKPDSKVRLLHGDCKNGVDALADLLLRAWGLGELIDKYPADWDRLGIRAGPLRNEKMVSLCTPRTDVLIAFPGEGNGTKGCLKLAIQAGLIIHSYPV